MFTVRIEKDGKRSAYVTVSYTLTNMVGPGSGNKCRQDYVTTLFGDIEGKARRAADRIIRKWREEIEAKENIITYTVK